MRSPKCNPKRSATPRPGGIEHLDDEAVPDVGTIVNQSPDLVSGQGGRGLLHMSNPHPLPTHNRPPVSLPPVPPGRQETKRPPFAQTLSHLGVDPAA